MIQEEKDERTTYSILDEYGDKSSIALYKFVADALQELLPDVHSWIQATYNKVVEKRPHLGRREKGNAVRVLALNEAAKSPSLKKILDDLL